MKQLLNENRKICKALYETFGIDWQKSVLVKQVILPTTLNAIIKNTPEITKSTLNLMLIQDKYDKVENEKNIDYNVIKFDNAGNFDIDVRFSWGSGLDNYYRKSDFNEARKDKDLKAFIIVTTNYNTLRQKADNKALVDFDTDINTRVNVKNAEFDFCYTASGKYINRVRNLQLNNAKFTYPVEYYNHQVTEPHQVIDKSGYNTFNARYELQRKAAQRKADKDKEKLLHTDFTRENFELAEKIQAAKKMMSDKILTTSNLYDLHMLLYNLDDVNKKYNQHLQKLREIAGENHSYYYSYGNIETVKNHIESMQKSLDYIIEHVEKLDEEK